MIRVFRVLIPASVLALFLFEAVLIFACYATVAYFQDEGNLFLIYDSGWQQIAIVEGLILAGMYFRHLYENVRVISRILLLQQLSVVFGITFIAQALIGYWIGDLALPRNVLIWGSALSLGAVFIARILFSVGLLNKVGGRRLLFIGMSPTVIQLASHFRQHPEYGLLPIGYLDRAAAALCPDSEMARLGPVADLPQIMEEHRPDWIVVNRREEIQPRWLDDLIELRFGGMRTERAASLYETTLGRVCAAEIKPGALVFSDSLQPNAFNLKLQSFYSKAAALGAVLVTFPFVAILALLMKAKSAGPLLLSEKRVGLNGKQFTMYRFDWPNQRGSANGIAKMLCDLGLDCYPQFWNVLRGDMSIVGPSPDRPEFAARLNSAIPFHMQRTAVKPGMTGWAQIHSGRLGLGRDTMGRLEYDLYYVKNLSPSLDLSVILRSVREALTFGGFAAA